MRQYWDSGTDFRQPTIEELREKASQSMKTAKGKGKQYEPVIAGGGRKICHTWWGEAWCNNLERYADFASRIDRGKRYVRSGTVLDLRIQGGRIEARVQGSRRTPYKVEVRISPLSEEKCQTIIAQCGSRITNIESLIHGEFPEDLKELFTGENGLFPTPREISFGCSCPDWALMCKHVAAVMYGIGVRLDENPFYFFQLRGIDVERFIDVTLKNSVEMMLAHADCKSERILKSDIVKDLFGIV